MMMSFLRRIEEEYLELEGLDDGGGEEMVIPSFFCKGYSGSLLYKS